MSFVAFSGYRLQRPELAALGVQSPGLRSRAAAVEALPPLGVLTLAGMTPDDWSVSLHEPTAVDDDLVQAIVNEAPTVVAISAVTASVSDAYRLCERLRAEGCPTVIGGLHVTTLPDEAGRHADAVVIGDGESSWFTVLEDAASGSLRPRYKAATPFDLRASPVPRFDLVDGHPRPRFTLQTQRGCPLACEFCAASRLLGPFREKPIERIAAELKVIRSCDPRPVIELADDNTFVGRRKHGQLLSVLSGANARWFTEVDWRLGEQPDLLHDLAASGCVQVLIGLEAVRDTHRGMGAKATSYARMNDAIIAIHDAGVAVIGCAVVGVDGETAATIDQLGDALEESPCVDIQVTLQTPFPGTALRRRLAAAGRLPAEPDWSRHTLFDLTYQPDQMSAADLDQRYIDLMQRLHRPEASRQRAARRRAVWARHPRLRP